MKVCNTAVLFVTKSGTNGMLRVSEDMTGRLINRELCEFNSFGDVRVCTNWDTGEKDRDMKDSKGEWYAIADE
jgi:hypothetical protein